MVFLNLCQGYQKLCQNPSKLWNAFLDTPEDACKDYEKIHKDRLKLVHIPQDSVKTYWNSAKVMCLLRLLRHVKNHKTCKSQSKFSWSLFKAHANSSEFSTRFFKTNVRLIQANFKTISSVLRLNKTHSELLGLCWDFKTLYHYSRFITQLRLCKTRSRWTTQDSLKTNLSEYCVQTRYTSVKTRRSPIGFGQYPPRPVQILLRIIKTAQESFNFVKALLTRNLLNSSRLFNSHSLLRFC